MADLTVLQLGMETGDLESGSRRARESLSEVSRAAESMAASVDKAERSVKEAGQAGTSVQGAMQALRTSVESADRAHQQLRISVEDVARDVGMARGAFKRGEIGLSDFALAMEIAREQATQLGVAGGGDLSRVISAGEIAIAQATMATDGWVESTMDAVKAGDLAKDSMNAMAAEILAARKALEQGADGMDVVEAASKRSVSGVGMLRSSMASLAAQVAGVHPVMGRLANVVGSFAMGSAMMIGVLAGMAALAYAWQRLTEDTRKAREEMEDALDRLRDLQERQRIEALGPGGEFIDLRDSVFDKLVELAEQREAAIRSFNLAVATSSGVGVDLLRERLDQDLKNIDEHQREVLALLAAGEAEIARARARADQEVARRSHANEDMIRSARQAVELAGLEGEAQQRLAIEYEATNRLIAARRDLQGELLAETEAAIDVWRRLSIEAVEVARATREMAAAYRELDDALKKMAFPTAAAPQGDSGLILTPVTPYGSRPGAAPPASDDFDLGALVDTMDAVRELTRGFSDLSEVMEDLSPVVSSLAGSLDMAIQGVARFSEGSKMIDKFEELEDIQKGLGGNLGVMGIVSQVSGIMSIGGAVVGLVDSLISSGRRAREAIRNIRESVREYAESLEDRSILEQQVADATKVYENQLDSLLEQLPKSSALVAHTQAVLHASEGGPEGVNRAALEAMAEMGGRLGGIAAGILEAVDAWEAATEKAREAAELAREHTREDFEVRALRAQGLDVEADRLQMEIAHRREIDQMTRDWGEDWKDLFPELWELIETTHDKEKARFEENLQLQEEAAAAAREFSIAMTDLDISARRAALSGDDLEAFTIRRTIQAEQEKKALRDLVESNDILPEQYEILSDIIDQEVIQSINDFQQAALDLAHSLMEAIDLEWLEMFGEEGEAAIYRAQKRFADWQEQILEMVETGTISPEKAEEYIGKAQEITDKAIEDAIAAAEGQAARSAADRRREAAARDHIIRRVAGISETQALTLTDIGYSQLGVLQEIAFNTSVLRGSDGVTNWGTPVQTGPATIEQQTIYDTGTNVNVSLIVQGHMLGSREDARAIGYEIGAGVNEYLGQERQRAKRRTGNAHRGQS